MKRLIVFALMPLFTVGIVVTALVACGTKQEQGGDQRPHTRGEKVNIRGTVTDLDQYTHTNAPPAEDQGKSSNPSDSVSSDDPVTETPRLKDQLGYIFVEGKLEEDTTDDKASISVKKSTVILQQRGKDIVPVEFKDLAQGAKVEVTFTGPVQESYPVGATAGKIVILEND